MMYSRMVTSVFCDKLAFRERKMRPSISLKNFSGVRRRIMSLERFSKYIKDVTVLQRMIFAVGNLPSELSNLWSIVVEFGVAEKEKMDTIKPDEARILLQNLADINKEALEMTKDRRLFLELINFHFEGNTPSQSLGVILMSSRQNCLKCNTPLTIRTD